MADLASSGQPIGALRFVLARTLRELREAAGVTRPQLARRKAGSESKWKMIEAGQIVPKPADVEFVCRIYGQSAETIAVMSEIAAKASEKTWWDSLGKTLNADTNFRVYLSLESFASEIFLFAPFLIPGLVQVPLYRAAQFALVPNLDVESAERMRRTRQEETVGRAKVTVVLAEECLHREIGGPEGMLTQLCFLRALDERADTSVSYIPFTAGAHEGGFGDFTILRFAAELRAPAMLYTDGYKGGSYDSDSRVLADIERRAAALRGRSVPIKEFRR